MTMLLHPFKTSHLIPVIITQYECKIRGCVCYQNLDFCVGQMKGRLYCTVRLAETPTLHNIDIGACSDVLYGFFWLSNVFYLTAKTHVPQWGEHQFTLSRER